VKKDLVSVTYERETSVTFTVHPRRLRARTTTQRASASGCRDHLDFSEDKMVRTAIEVGAAVAVVHAYL
jgi:hypothetical protein